MSPDRPARLPARRAGPKWARMAAVDPRRLPLYVDLAAIAEVPDAAAALRALDRLEITRAQVGPGRPVGDGWAAEAARWEGRLLLHHACLADAAHPRWNLAAGDEEIRKRSVAEAAEALRVAAGLGAPFYAVHAGWALKLTRGPDDKPAGDTITPLRARDQLCRSLDRLAELADRRGIGLLVENAPDAPADRPVFADPELMPAVLERLGAAPLGILLDLPALVITARRRAEEPETLLDHLRPHVRALEIHRGDGVRRRHGALRENDLELALAKRAGGLALPVILAPRDLSPDALRDQVLMAAELLAPAPAPIAEVRPPVDAEDDGPSG